MTPAVERVEKMEISFRYWRVGGKERLHGQMVAGCGEDCFLVSVPSVLSEHWKGVIYTNP